MLTQSLSNEGRVCDKDWFAARKCCCRSAEHGGAWGERCTCFRSCFSVSAASSSVLCSLSNGDGDCDKDCASEAHRNDDGTHDSTLLIESVSLGLDGFGVATVGVSKVFLRVIQSSSSRGAQMLPDSVNSTVASGPMSLATCRRCRATFNCVRFDSTRSTKAYHSASTSLRAACSFSIIRSLGSAGGGAKRRRVGETLVAVGWCADGAGGTTLGF